MTERGNKLLRICDERIGPPLIKLLSSFRKKKDTIKSFDKIGVLCIGAIGDALFATSIIKALEKHYPNSDIYLICSSDNSVILSIFPHIKYIKIKLRNFLKTIVNVRRSKFDLIVDTSQWARFPEIICSVSGAHTVGFLNPEQGRGYSYDSVVKHSRDIHEIENFRNLLNTLQITNFHNPSIALPRETESSLDNKLGKNYVVFHCWPAGTNSDWKCWPDEHWVELGKYLAERNISVVFTGSKQDTRRTDSLINKFDFEHNAINCAGTTSLLETAQILHNASLVVSVNTAIMHLAAAVGSNLIALCGPTNPKRWGPLSQNAFCPQPASEPHWYLNLGFEYPDEFCDSMRSISVQDVIEHIEKYELLNNV